MIFFKHNKKKFIFVHIPKSAGTSVKETLKKRFIDSIDLSKKKGNPIINFVKGVSDHMPVSAIKEYLLEEDIHFICVVRNPWARMCSLFQHVMMRPPPTTAKKFYLQDALGLDDRISLSKIPLIEFRKEFHRKQTLPEKFEFWLFFFGKQKRLTPSGNPNLNIIPQDWWYLSDQLLTSEVTIFKYEQLDRLEGFLGVNFPKYNPSIFRSNDYYKKVYNEKTKQYVADLDYYTIKEFKYSF